MKILVTGSNGQLGYEIIKKGARHGFDIVALDKNRLDITNKTDIIEAVSENDIFLIVNAAAYTNVDKAESEQEHAFAVNCDAVSNIAKVCSDKNIALIHISTDYVFDGNKDKPYKESDRTNPLGIYGESKRKGEEKIRIFLEKHIILRTAWLYGLNGTNFVKTMLNLGREKSSLKVVNDQFGCPTYAADLADAIYIIADHIKNQKKNLWGTYHFCGLGITSWYDFAKKIFEIAAQYEIFNMQSIEPVCSSQYLTKAKRPLNSAFDCSLIFNHFGIKQEPWTESLKKMLNDLYIL